MIIGVTGIPVSNFEHCTSCDHPLDPATGSKRNVVALNSIWGTYGDGIRLQNTP